MLKRNFGFLLLICLITFCEFKILNAKNDLKPRLYKCGISDRTLIKSANYHFNSINKTSLKTTSSPDSLKLLAIRVEFELDNNRNTTGNGKFDLSDTTDYVYNPPPHNRQYFENQLLALADYFANVSHNKLILTGEVFPKELNNAYQLPHKMSYYNPNTTDEELNQRLAELFRDSFMAADSSDTIDFSNYDCFIVFHAGVGADITFDWDTTPNDIPSVFLNFQDFKNALGQENPDFNGIHVTNNIIRDGIILPETENQEDENFALLGIAAIMFGHQLGLPNLYDTDTGRPGIGIFGLMDQGFGNYRGLMPAQPCAWSKVFLGWEQPIEISAGSNIKVAAALANNENKIYKIPINAREYFLIENRQRHILTEDNITVGKDANGLKLEFKKDGRITPPSSEDIIDVIVHIDEYDYGLPYSEDVYKNEIAGSGILIWHIDENVIEANYEENRINADIDHRGVDLEEADGAQDIGHFYNFFGITGYEPGTEWDLWYKDNDAYQLLNETEDVIFTHNSMPNSRSNSGANSHISITNFNNSDSIMSFTLSTKTFQENFPQNTGSNLGTNSVVSGDLDGINGDEIIAAAINGKIFGWHANGSAIINNNDSLNVVNLRGDTNKISLALFAEIDDSILYTPALGDMDNDDELEVIVASKSGQIYVFQENDVDGDRRADSLFTYNCHHEITTSPLITNLGEESIIVGHNDGKITAITEKGLLLWQKSIAAAPIAGLSKYSHSTVDSIVVTTKTGDVCLIDKSGDVKWQQTIANTENLSYPAVGDINNDGSLEIVVCSGQGLVVSFDKFGNTLFESAELNIVYSNPTIADLDNNGYLEIVIAGDRCVYAYNYNGTLVDDFPITIDSDKNGFAYPDPIIADLDSDGDAEIIVSTENEMIAYHHTGRKVDDFPLSISGKIGSTPTLSDLDDDGKTNLAYAASDGYVYVWNLKLTFEEDNIFWGSYLHDEQRTGLASPVTAAPQPSTQIMPETSVYNWPNPTEGNYTTIRYWLNEAAAVTIRIYDMAGELVKELNGTGFAHTANEIQLSLENIQSGVYLTRVEAKSGTQSSVSFFKMAVVK